MTPPNQEMVKFTTKDKMVSTPTIDLHVAINYSTNEWQSSMNGFIWASHLH